MNLIRIPILLLAALALPLTACEYQTTAPPNPTNTTNTTNNSKTATTMKSENDQFPVHHTDAQWKELLTPQQYAVLREKATDRPFTGKYDNFYQPGTYYCAACGQELFSSDTKFNAGCGWPSFYAAKAGDHIKLVQDNSFGMHRTEVLCARCGSHLGHLFDDAPQTPTGQRFCINSTSLKFVPASTTTTRPSHSK